VATVENPENLGFAGGMNVGLRWALHHGRGTITLLNNDTLVPAGALAALAARASTGAAVSPEVRYADGSESVWFGGGEVDPRTNLAHHIGERQLSEPRADGTRATTTLAGCCLTATADTWRKVGYFDERYFLNFEDSDWSLRARELGVPLLVDTCVHIYHRVSASFTGAYSYLGQYYYVRNGLLFGRERCAGSWRQSRCFLRHHALPGLADRARSRQWRQLGIRSAVVGAALVDFALRRLGRAPRWLEARSARWAERDRA
jgi:GT2 family glycosyltransferase